jgi:hypothetical protein
MLRKKDIVQYFSRDGGGGNTFNREEKWKLGFKKPEYQSSKQPNL